MKAPEDAPAVEVVWTPRPPAPEIDRRLAELLFGPASDEDQP